MQNSYNHNRAWSDAYLPQINDILLNLPMGLFVDRIRISTAYEDMRQATDFKILQSGKNSIACRVRRQKYIDRYAWEVTIRNKTRYNTATELEKILDGHSNYMFYGHTASGRIVRWFLLDLDVFRECWVDGPGGWQLGKPYNEYCGRFPAPVNYWHETKDNGDGTGFFALDVRWWPTPMVLASNDYETFMYSRGALDAG